MKITCTNCGNTFEHDFDCTMCGSSDITLIRELNDTTSIRCKACGSFSPAFAICPSCRSPIYDIEADEEDTD